MKKKYIFLIIFSILLLSGFTVWFLVFKNFVKNKQQSSTLIVNLNTSSEINKTNNPDETMGPANWKGNYSNTLSPEYLGTLYFQIGSTADDKPHNYTSFIISVSKIEVHLDHSLSTTPPIEIFDKWETLNAFPKQLIDLVALSDTKNVSTLAATILAGGQYSEVRFYIARAAVTLSDGTQIKLEIGDKQNIIRVAKPFRIVPHKYTTLNMYFDTNKSITKEGDKYVFTPNIANLEVISP